MSDYIKREDVMELLDMLLEHYHDTGVEVIKHTATIAPKEFHISEEDDIADFNLEIDAWKRDFSNIQSADVAPVVRCKDCKHSRNDELWHMRWCKGVTVKDEHFCADGERKDNG